MKVGLFFGSFNPVHVGHMIIANHLAEYTDLNQIWMVVSPHNPLKNKASLAKDNDRYHLVLPCMKDGISTARLISCFGQMWQLTKKGLKHLRDIEWS